MKIAKCANCKMVIIPKSQKNVPVNNSHLKVHVHERGKERQEKYMSVHIQVYTAYIRLRVHLGTCVL